MKNDTFPASGPAPGLAPVNAIEAEVPSNRTLRQRLRSETRERHERLDKRFEGMHLAATPAAYHRFVRMNAACHAAIEPILAASPLTTVFPDWSSRDRSAHLARDLAEMDLPAVAPLPAVADRPGLPEAIGMAYVLEGSRLGGRHIFRLVRGRHADEAWSRATFHYLESTDEPDRFRDFTSRAAAALVKDTEIDRAVAAANACFDLFIETERRLSEASSDASAEGREP